MRLARVLIVSFVLLILSSNMLSCAKGVDDAWDSKNPIPSPINGLAALNAKIYAFAINTTYEYNPVTDEWLAKSPIPTSRSSFGTAVYLDRIYVIGGHEKTDLNGVVYCSSANQVYYPLTDSWENKASLPTAREQLQANVVNGKIYLMGGKTGGQYTTVALNEVYDPSTDSWIRKTPMLIPVAEYTSAVINDKIYIIGGINEFATPSTVASVQIYDPTTDTWSFGASIPNPISRSSAGCTSGVLAPSRIYHIGGLEEKGLIGSTINQVYNPETDSWSSGASMPTARYGAFIAVINDELYLMGGFPYFNMQGVYSYSNEHYFPIGYQPLLLEVISPANTTYRETKVPLNFKLIDGMSIVSYSLDDGATIGVNGNTTLDSLSNGSHKLTVYANNGNYSTSKTIDFTIAQAATVPNLSVIVIFGTVIALAVIILVYLLNKRNSVNREKRLNVTSDYEYMIVVMT